MWKPSGYDRSTAGIVVYVHGYFTDVDGAWRRHRLPRQFAASDLNALFIACEAPVRTRDPVRWSSIAELLDTVTERLHEPLPEGRVVAVGHSAAHRTLSLWLAEDIVDAMVLVDALYGDMPELRDWLDADPERRLIDAAVVTRKWSDELHASIPDTLTFDAFPREGRLVGARKARVVYVRSQHGHMELVTEGVALPMLLRATRLCEVDAC